MSLGRTNCISCSVLDIVIRHITEELEISSGESDKEDYDEK